ncbi:MAG: hypothetical protein GY729_16410 [Desulfobacteraceae bacterium]|nr:hypothetical protein [Desulfobacteraceae bacterium]
MKSIIQAVIIILLLVYTHFEAAAEPFFAPQKIEFTKIEYALGIDIHSPEKGDWKPLSQFMGQGIMDHNSLWLLCRIPAKTWEQPGIYIKGYIDGLEVYLEEKKIYEAGKIHLPGSLKPIQIRGIFFKHIIPIPRNRTEDAKNDPVELYLMIPYSHPYDLGPMELLYAGDIRDLIPLAEKDTLDTLRFQVPLFCLGAVLLFTGILLLVLFFIRFNQKYFPFLSFGCFLVASGISYLNLMPVLAAFGFGYRLWFTIEVIASLLIPIGILAFVEQIFVSGLGRILRRLWQVQILVAIAAGIWFLADIIPQLIFLGDLFASVSIVFALISIINSKSSPALSVKASRMALAGIMIFAATACVDVLHELGIIGFGGYYYGLGILGLMVSFGYALADHYSHMVQQAKTAALKLSENKQELASLKQANLKARLEALKNQMNPHFLFNTLGTLMTLIEENQELAVEYIQELSKVYRYLLQTRDRRLVTVAREMAFINSYITLVSMRFKSTLSVHINIPQKKYKESIPPLSLQLLLENALKHNVISKSRPLTIDIFIEDEAYITVRNNLQKKKSLEKSHKIGLNNLENQYKFFTEKNVLVMPSKNFFTVKIPLLTTGPKPHNRLDLVST